MITVNIQIEPTYEAEFNQANQARLRTVVESTLQNCEIAKAELTVVVTSDDVIRELNQQYRQIDAPTDVLSFAADLSSPAFVLPPDVDPYLGDVIISFPTAARQAQATGHTTLEEVLLLAIHGTLHLIGFDHMTPAEKRAMWQKQDTILRLNHLAHVVPTE